MHTKRQNNDTIASPLKIVLVHTKKGKTIEKRVDAYKKGKKLYKCLSIENRVGAYKKGKTMIQILAPLK